MTYQVTDSEFSVAQQSGHIAGDWITWAAGGEVWRTQVSSEATPELSSGALLLIGALPVGFAWWRRRRA